jgi:AMMECR1 domain-containing protein
VAPEQGWNKEETIVSLMRKAGWGGRGREWRAVSGLRVVRYEGEKAEVGFREFKRWKEWFGGRG